MPTEIRCPKLDMPVNGGYKCTDGSYFNSRCEFFCSPGYTLKGQKTAVCQYNKVWSAAGPTCVGKTVCVKLYHHKRLQLQINTFCGLTTAVAITLTFKFCFLGFGRNVLIHHSQNTTPQTRK